MINFKRYLEFVNFDKTKTIKKGLKKYQPGTFGVEIEFKPANNNSNDDLDLLLRNSSDVYKDFLASLKIIGKSPDKMDEEEYDEKLNDFISRISRDVALTKYNIKSSGVNSRDHQNKIDEYISFIKSLGSLIKPDEATATEFGIGFDAGFIELRTPICTTKDFPILRKIFDKLKHETLSGEGSAHVHIGMPSNTNGFDLLAMTTLADEEQLKKDAGRNRNFEDWAALRTMNHKQIWYMIDELIKNKQEVIVGDEDIKNLAINTKKYHGTNLRSFGKLGTVEFRYLSSEILKDINKFFEYIQYYLILPNIAQSRKQIKIEFKGNFFTLTRMPGSNVKITRNKNSKQSQESPSELRQANLPADLIERNFLRRYGHQQVDGLLWILFISGDLSVKKQLMNNFNLTNDKEFKKYTVNQLWSSLNSIYKQKMLKVIKKLKH